MDTSLPDYALHGRRGATLQEDITGPTSSTLRVTPVAIWRSRFSVRNNAYAARAIDVLTSNIVGTGARPISLVEDEDFKRRIQDLWKEWSRQADATGSTTFEGLQELAIRSMAEGGDSFARLRVRRLGDGFVVPLQLQLIEAEQVPHALNEKSPRGNPIIGGIEFNFRDAPIAYHMLKNHPGEFLYPFSPITNLDTVRIPAEQVLHVHKRNRPSEVRTQPWLVRVLIKLAELDRYDDAELVRKKAAALIGGFIRRPHAGDELNLGVGDVVSGGDGDLDEIEDMEPGTFPVLPPGYDVSFSQPADVGVTYGPFMEQQLRTVAIGTNTLFEQITGDYSKVNDRTIRAAALEFKRMARQWQSNQLIFQFCQPVWERFMDMAILSGALELPPGITAQEAKRVKWIPHGWEHLNPSQEVTANKLAVRAGFKTREDVILERGEDIVSVDEGLAKEKEREEQLGLIFDTNPATNTISGSAHNSASVIGEQDE